jgi:uncharacterized phage infection (PIP) family protein YhgE
MVQMEEQIDLYAKQIENLKGGSHLLQSAESSDPTTRLSKALVDLNMKGAKIDKLKKTIATQNEEIKDKDKVIAEYQKLKTKMQTNIDQMKDKLFGKPYLIGARHIIWDEIINEVSKIWDYFKIIDDEILLTDEVDDTLKKSFKELGTRPQVATQIIKFLNSNSSEVLIRKGVKDRTTMVMEDERIFTKLNLLQIAQNKCISVKRDIDLFTNRFEKLVKIGLP